MNSPTKQGTTKCICFICNCGRHKCPAKVHKTKWDPDAITKYVFCEKITHLFM